MMDVQAFVTLVDHEIERRKTNGHYDELLPETRTKYAYAINTMSVWIKNANTVVVDTRSNVFSYVAAEVLDMAAQDVTDGAPHIYDTPQGALIKLHCTCGSEH